MATLFKRHGKTILTELYGFSRRHIDLYVGLFLAFISSAFLIQSDNTLVILLSSITFIIAVILIARRIILFFRRTLT
jgi:hypothetical protein